MSVSRYGLASEGRGSVGQWTLGCMIQPAFSQTGAELVLCFWEEHAAHWAEYKNAGLR